MTDARWLERVTLALDPADRRHAEIDFRGPSCVVRDLESTGGTWLDGEIVRGDRPLRTGNLLRVGPTELRVVA